MGAKGKSQRKRAKTATVLLTTFISLLALTSTAQAGSPFHSRAASLDITGLNHACGVTTDNKGDLYASSAGTSEVKVYDPSHTLLASISNTNEPCALAVTTTGNLYVSEEKTGEVVRYVPNKYPFEGAPTYGPREVIDASGNAEGIAVDRTDDRLYVAESTHVAIYKADGSFEASVGEGQLTEATGVAAYTYIYTGSFPSNLFRHYYLAVADAATDEVKVFAAKEGSPLKLRRTITGVDHDEDPETPEQEFGFGAEGAQLAADPGNESRETLKCTQIAEQACTQGHLFLYDAEHKAVDELDATGEFVDQVTNEALTDAEPTALAVERSGTANDGTLYVGTGSGTGAKLLAFKPLTMPIRKALPALSRVLTGARAVAVDCEGYVYVGTATEIRVYDPAGKEVTKFPDAEAPFDLAVDCEGNVYVVDGPNSTERNLTYYTPSAYPPTGTTTYNRTEPPLIPGEFEGNGLQAVAVNPANGHAFVVGGAAFPPIIVEYAPPAEESKVIGECGEGLGLSGGRLDIDVYAATGELYVTAGQKNLATIRCGAEPERLIQQIKGGGCPNGEFGANPRVAIDQSNGHILEYANNQPGATAREYDSSGACVTEYGKFSTSGSYRIAIDSSCALHDPPLTEQTTPTCSSLYPSNGNVYVASDGFDNTVQPYDLSAFGPLDYGEEPTTAKYKLTVEKTGTGAGTVTSSPAGINCGSECSAEYEEGTEVTLSATPDEGSSAFKGWTGCESEPEGKCVVTMSSAKEVTATFEPEPTGPTNKHTLTLTKAPNPSTGAGIGTVTSKAKGINCASACAEAVGRFYKNSSVVLTAKPYGETSTFKEWKGCDSIVEGKCVVSLTEDKAVEAVFAGTSKAILSPTALTLSKGDSEDVRGYGTVKAVGLVCESECEETTVLYQGKVESPKVIAPKTVELKALAAFGSKFTGWSGGGCSGTEPTCKVTMSEAMTVTAEFEAVPNQVLTVEKAYEGGLGTVSSKPKGVMCAMACTQAKANMPEGAAILLTAKPAVTEPPSTFTEWKGGDCEGLKTTTCTVTMDKAETVKALFSGPVKAIVNPQKLTLTKAGSGVGTVKAAGLNCEALCTSATTLYYGPVVVPKPKTGAKVVLKALTLPGSTSVSWSGCESNPTPNECVVVMSESKSVTAKFDELE